MVIEGDVTRGDEHTVQYTDGILQNCTPENYIILLTNVTCINKKINRKKESTLPETQKNKKKKNPLNIF